MTGDDKDYGRDAKASPREFTQADVDALVRGGAAAEAVHRRLEDRGDAAAVASAAVGAERHGKAAPQIEPPGVNSAQDRG